MENQFTRSEMLLGKESREILKNSRVALFGVGGVGGAAAEALIRNGVGTLDIIDNDRVCITNLNRQIIATHETIGELKTVAAEKRLKSINPDAKIILHQTFYTPETTEEFDFSQYDYIIDAIDTVSGKLSLIEQAKKHNVPIICAMGAGNKLDPTKFEVADISKTSVCPLARVIRTELKKRAIKGVKTVYSKEIPTKPTTASDSAETKPIPGSVSFVPPVVGYIIAGEVIKDLCKIG